MKECEYTSRLGSYYDGELSGESAAEMERHLQDCRVCAAELDRLRGLSHLLASAARPQPSPELMVRLHRRVDIGSYVSVRRTAEILAAAAAVVLIVCSAWLTTVPGVPESAGPIPLWETAAAGQQGVELAAASAEQQLAMWTIYDLAGNKGND